MQNTQHFRPTKAIIDLQAIQNNVRHLKEYLKPNVQIMAVVKANAFVGRKCCMFCIVYIPSFTIYKLLILGFFIYFNF